MAIQRLFHELGLHSLFASALDTKIIILQRFIRFFAFGGSTIVLALYLHEHDIPASQIGLFMSLTFVGDIISFGLSLVADGIGRKHVLAIGALMMAFSGFTFATSGNFWILLFAGVVGIISPNGREIGPFTSIEESTLAHLTAPEIRSDIFAWYVVIGSAGSAAGKFVTGWAVQQLQNARGWTSIRSYQAVFFTYAILGMLNFTLAWFLSSGVELQTPVTKPARDGEIGEEDALLPGVETEQTQELEKKRSLLPKISRESRGIIFRLCCLFAVDSLASGLVPASWVTYFFYNKFDLPTGSLGTIFSIMAILSAISSVVAASLSKRIGLINTMVFTHLPSAIALALIPIPSSLTGAIIFLIIRSSLASMDIAPKAAFLSMVVQPGERTAVMGFISVVRTFSQSCGPFITGLLAQSGNFWVTFIVAGSLKAAYDLGLLAAFSHHKVQDRDSPQAISEELEA
ncbi:related to Staphylococcus multidrug resistance protein [Phialocephala subalpina]|uniref:Related to Staphylococcus multidrug resistance protein n=1 Tax=Phialocephala subalpina TaxID=576137 RepID=A0A1L7XS56_9HELO|nr:related to Staphylococcus multidrug resistance protein [Phialocephala subalpina]